MSILLDYQSRFIVHWDSLNKESDFDETLLV